MKYTYSISEDFPNQVVNPDRLAAEVGESEIVTALDYINTSDGYCDIWFKGLLDEVDEAILDEIVVAHSGDAYPVPPTVITTQKTAGDGVPQFEAVPRAMGMDRFVRISDGVEQMAVDGRSTTAENIWDGDTGADWTRGGIGSESSDAAHSGDNGLDTGASSQNDIWWFDKGSDRDLETAPFDSVSFWINPQAYPSGSVLRCGWAASGETTLVGQSVGVRNYLPDADLGIWQRVSIPLVDFNLSSTPVGRFIFQACQTGGQQYYIDDLDLLNSTGDGPYRYRVAGVAGERRHVARITLALASSQNGWNSSAFADIANGLELGLIFRQGCISDQMVMWSVVMKDNLDLFGHMVSVDPVTFANGEMLVLFTIEPKLSAIVLTEDDALEFVVRDDLSSLTNMRAYLQFGTEEV